MVVESLSVFERKLKLLDLFKDRIVPETKQMLRDRPGEIREGIELVAKFKA